MAGHKKAVPMPDALHHYWTMWNEPVLDHVRRHLDLAVSVGFVFADPMHFHTGRDALEENVRTLRSNKPHYRFAIASELDVQNDCYRYEWHLLRKHRFLMRGFDVARINTDGQLARVDGFLGDLVPITGLDSGIPEFLRTESRS